jgi:hypothetical protein
MDQSMDEVTVFISQSPSKGLASKLCCTGDPSLQHVTFWGTFWGTTVFYHHLLSQWKLFMGINMHRNVTSYDTCKIMANSNTVNI